MIKTMVVEELIERRSENRNDNSRFIRASF
uniref:Uncharacterized protein n=1 Tax=Arundo donax TaxID=35708 RepID=A0A0A8ZJP4_ARUDO